MMQISAVNIVIIEDDLILLQTYKMLIEEETGLFVTGIYPSYEKARKDLLLLQPHVILLDIQLPGISGIEALPLIKLALPKVHIIALTAFESEELVFQALQNGASGYITKDVSSTKIIGAIKEVYEGGGPMSTRVARIVIKSFERNASSPLSKRETEILNLISEGKKRNEIAKELFIERETVKTHIKNIYAKLDVNSRSAAILAAKKNRLL
jgi:DNA-binding NarL/FixJ family response regulator